MIKLLRLIVDLLSLIANAIEVSGPDRRNITIKMYDIKTQLEKVEKEQ